MRDIFEFILKLSEGRAGTTLLLLWLTSLIVLIFIFIISLNIMNLISNVQRNSVHKREMKLKRSIYNRFADIARDAVKNNNYIVATNTMIECTKVLFDDANASNEYYYGDGYDATTNESDIPRDDSESVPEQSRQDSDRLSDESKKSFAEITD